MPVYYAYTRDGVQFDGCVAMNEQNAEQVIRYRYSKSAIHFVGEQERTTEELLNGMRIKNMPDISEAMQLTIEQRAEEEAAVSSGQTLKRLTDAIDDMQSHK